MILQELNFIELELLSEIQNVSGLIEEKYEQLEQAGIFERYLNVFKGYSSLINDSRDGTEALKRAVFLFWYQSAEPSFLSGVDLMPENAGRKVLEKLDNEVKNQNLDFEFEWMLSHYIQVIDFVFSELPNVKRFAMFANKEIWENRFHDTTQFENRGQMGTYWISVIESNKERLNFEVRKNERKNTEK